MALRLHGRRLVLRYSSSRSFHNKQPPSPSWVSEALMAVILRDINNQPFSRGYRSWLVEKRPTRAGFLPINQAIISEDALALTRVNNLSVWVSASLYLLRCLGRRSL